MKVMNGMNEWNKVHSYEWNLCSYKGDLRDLRDLPHPFCHMEGHRETQRGHREKMVTYNLVSELSKATESAGNLPQTSSLWNLEK